MLRTATVSGESAESTMPTKSTRTKVIQGVVGFAVMFVVLWWVFSRLGRNE